MSMMKTLDGMRASSVVLLLSGCVSCAIALSLPVHWGWESGHLENMQAALLLVGAVSAMVAAWQQRSVPGGAIWKVASLFWLVMLGRELAWGATLLAPLSFDPEHGPLYTSSVLWWKPAVKWMCMGLLALCVVWTLRHRLISRVGLRWWRESAMPWGALANFALAMVVGTLAEREGAQWLPMSAGGLLVLEEMAECWAYLALWWAQWSLQQHMLQWRASAYVTTLQLALPKRLQGRAM